MRRLHATGLAVLTYLNPLVCQPYGELFDRALATGAFQARPGGGAYLYPGFVGGSIVGSRVLGQLDFTGRAGRDLFAGVVREAVRDGHDGWMEDFGEYTPPDAVSAGGRRGVALHNAYPRQYHCAAAAIARREPRPLVRFVRSGWTGAARCATVVWGGDPTTSWGFDGLAARSRVALAHGALGDQPLGHRHRRLLLPRAGPADARAARALDRARRGLGGDAHQGRRHRHPGQAAAADLGAGMLPVWRRWAKLRTQLYPYWRPPTRTTARTGLPIMRHLVLASPG